MIEAKLKKLSKGHSDLCQAIYRGGPCPFQAEEHTDRCRIHAGIHLVNKYHEEQKYMLRAAKWSARINELANDDQVKTLREEIGVTRMLLEETLNKCTDETELLMYSASILSIVDHIRVLVVNCTRLEDRLGMVLDKSTVLNIAEQISQILTEFIPSDKIIEVSAKITESILAQSQKALGSDL
jgi:hypothetical protein